MGLPDTLKCGLRMRREWRERFPRYRLQRKPLVSDLDMNHGTCVTHVPWCMSGSLTQVSGENLPGILGACATRNFTYLVRGPWNLHHIYSICHRIKPNYCGWIYASCLCSLSSTTWLQHRHLIITVTLQERHAIAKHRLPDGLFESFPRPTSKKTSKLRITDPMWRESARYRRIPVTKGQYNVKRLHVILWPWDFDCASTDSAKTLAMFPQELSRGMHCRKRSKLVHMIDSSMSFLLLPFLLHRSWLKLNRTLQ